MNRSLFRHLAEAEENRRSIWMATVIGVEGSTPAKMGMKMIIDPEGKTEGTIGGGMIEYQVIQRTVREQPTLPARWRYDLGLDLPGESVEPTGMKCGGYQEIFLEPLFTGTPLYIFGGGHCSMALSEIAGRCGFRVTVVDDRAEWADEKKHPFACRCLCFPFAEVAERIPFSSDLFLVIMTRGHQHDELVLRQCIDKKYRYLGMMGSENKVRDILQRLQQEGINRELLAGIYSPIGLSIGSSTPEEIAVSILAQIIALKNGRQPQSFSSNPLIR